MASCVFLLFLLFLHSAAASEVKSVKSGDDVTLSCRADGGSIRAVEWTRTDLKSEYVLFYRGSNTIFGHPFFKGRVQLVDSKLKDGDVSLILKNVNMNDRGTYECRVATGSSGLQKDPIRRFRLEVTDSDVISVKPGDDATLSCQAAVDYITVVDWTRTEPSPAKDILHYTDGQSGSQHFLGRVQLVDSDLKDGDVSLILKNVTMNDRGTYECRVKRGGSRRHKRAINDSDPIRRFRLEVTDSGGDHKHVGWIAGGLFVVAVGVVFGAVVRRSNRRREQRPNPPDVDESVNNDLL